MTDEIKIHSYPKHIADWRSGTARMSLSQEGAYGRLCDQYYLEGGLECTFDECLRICAAVTKDERAAVKYVLDAKFDKTATGYSHGGMDKRIAAIREASAKNQERARLAAEKRWSKDAGGNATSIPQAMPSKSQKPVKDGSRISNEILSPSGEGVSEGFSEFVTAYPKAEGRNAALDEWNAAIEAGATPQSILTGLTASKTYWKKEKREERYIPNASAWLEKRGWLDHRVTHTAEPQKRFSDKTVRALVVREQSEEYASSYLDPADFDGGSMTIIAANGYACDKLKGLSCLGDYRIEKRSAAA